MANNNTPDGYKYDPFEFYGTKFGMTKDQVKRARAAIGRLFGTEDQFGQETLPVSQIGAGRYVPAPYPQDMSGAQPVQFGLDQFGSPLSAQPANTTTIPKNVMPAPEEAPPVPTKKPKKGKKADLSVPQPDVIRVGEATPQALAAAVKGVKKPLVIDGAMDLGLPHDRVMIMPGNAKVDPAKVLAVKQGVPVLSQQGFVDTLKYIRGL